MMQTQQLIEQLQQLKLHAMAFALQEQQQKPAHAQLTFEERLGLLIDRERLSRDNRRIQNLLRTAKLRQSACIEEVSYPASRHLNKSQFLSLARLDFISQKQNVFITGPTGCGKSYLACALGHQACRYGFRVRYLRLPRFLEELTIAHADGSYGKLLEQLLKTDLLILDDFGLTPLSTAQRHDLFNLIEDRHQLKSTLITSQLPIKHWHDYLGEPTLADAILDRLLEQSHRLELKGGSLRKTETDKEKKLNKEDEFINE